MPTYNYEPTGNLFLSNYFAFSYVAVGGLRLKNCGYIYEFIPNPKIFIDVVFREGDRAWLLKEAIKGKIKSVYIKKMIIEGHPYWSQRNTDVIYKDNLNQIYKINELITHQQAIDYAMAYNLKRYQQAEEALGCSS